MKYLNRVEKDYEALPEYIVLPNVLTLKECQGAIQYGQKHGRGTQGQIGSGSGAVDLSIRNTTLYWFQHSKLRDRIVSKIGEVNKMLWKYDINEFEAFQLGIYSKDGHYSWHKDAFDTTEPRNRKLSFTVLLNDPKSYTGGQFQLHSSFTREGKAIIKTLHKLDNTGSMVVFPSRTYHRVCPVQEGTRASLVGWAWGPKNG